MRGFLPPEWLSPLRRFLVGSLFGLAGCPAAFAALVDETSWVRDSPDERHRLVMLNEGDRSPEGIALGKNYPRSGVYSRGEAGDTLLWEIPSYFLEKREVAFSPDGNHVLLAQPISWCSIHNLKRPFTPYRAGVLCLHRDGTQQYWSEETLTLGWMTKSVLGRFLLGMGEFEWLETSCTPAAATYEITTSLGERHVIDLTTGGMVESHSLWGASTVSVLVGVPLLLWLMRRLGRPEGAALPRLRVSLGELVMLVTTAAVLLAVGRLGWRAPVAVTGVGLIGATIAWLIGRSRWSAWAGAWLSVCGAVLGLAFFAVGVEPLMWRYASEGQWGWLFAFYALPVGGAFTGSVVAARGIPRVAERFLAG